MRCDWCHKPGADVVRLLDEVPVRACGVDHAEMVRMMATILPQGAPRATPRRLLGQGGGGHRVGHYRHATGTVRNGVYNYN